MKVYFIGAGPGAADLITIRGQRLIEKCNVCLYAGSLVPKEIIECAPKNATVMDTAPMNLDEIMREMQKAKEKNENVARVHSGDPSIYGAIGEQMNRLDKMGIEYEIVPGVPAFVAVAAAMKRELTLPEIAQTVIITRTDMKASKMPEGENLKTLAQSGATLAIHLSIRNLENIKRELVPYYGEECPVVIAYRATWKDELYIETTLAEMKQKVREAKITRTALVVVGKVLGEMTGEKKFEESKLYDAQYSHVLRNKGKKKNN